MNVLKCDFCDRDIPSNTLRFKLCVVGSDGERRVLDFCSKRDMDAWCDENIDESKRPDFLGTHRMLDEKLLLPNPRLSHIEGKTHYNANVDLLNNSIDEGERIWAERRSDELEELAAVDALDDAIDAGLLEDEPATFEGEPLDIAALLARKHRSATSGQLRNHGLGAAATTARVTAIGVDH